MKMTVSEEIRLAVIGEMEARRLLCKPSRPVEQIVREAIAPSSLVPQQNLPDFMRRL
jgi:hypothetical protein